MGKAVFCLSLDSYEVYLMSARIRSKRNAITPIDEASRDDLVVTDIVTVQSLDAATTYAWALLYVPDGSAATFSGDVTSVSPGSFTVDLVGSYLVRLTVDATLGSEDTQYVRLRALTTDLGLHLIAAGERRDETGIIPVDASTTGWADEQNNNLQALEAMSVGLTTLTSGEALSANDAVTFDTHAGGGRAIKSNAGTAGRKFSSGVTRDAAAGVGLPVRVMLRPGSLVPMIFDAPPAAGDQGKTVYLHTVSGQVSLSAPTADGTTVIRVGILQDATGPTVLFLPQFVANNL